jgi:sulfoquinovosidase
VHTHTHALARPVPIGARTPIVRPLWFSDPRLGHVTRAFRLGRKILVAATFAPGRTTTTTAPLPAGRWTHVWSGRIHDGGRSVTVASPLGKPAVFVRAGSGLARIIRTAAR